MSIKAQDEIIEAIEKQCGADITVYTKFAIEWSIFYNLKNLNLNHEYRIKKSMEYEKRKILDNRELKFKQDVLQYFALLPVYNDEIILVYQPGKVGSRTVNDSIKSYGRHMLHCHVLKGIGDSENDICKILNMKAGKIITLVRDPVARQISAMWQNMTNINRYGERPDFAEVEKYYFEEGFTEGEFNWFVDEMYRVFKINVFDYPFDRQKGYGIIKQGNIELLLLKMEKLNNLEDVIGHFLNIDHFKLQSKNIGNKKPYRFALQSFKECFTVKQQELENLYKNNKYMKHFYSEEECDELYKKWMTHINDKI